MFLPDIKHRALGPMTLSMVSTAYYYTTRQKASTESTKRSNVLRISNCKKTKMIEIFGNWKIQAL